ncbi:MAG: CHAT domain-containing protein [Acidobacteriota bacterium]
MNFLDFQLRAWQSDLQVQVLVHSSPVGAMRRPVTLAFKKDEMEAVCNLIRHEYLAGDGVLQRVSEAAKCLSETLLPPEVYGYLVRSLERVGENGLRLRLCLDRVLIDAPWEFMRRPDASDDDLLDSFLILNPHLSMVREAPIESSKLEPSTEQQRMVIVGAYWPNGDDLWLVKEERQKLIEAVKPVRKFLLIDDKFETAAGNSIKDALSKPASVFHYSGHVDEDHDRGFLVREVLTPDNLEAFTLKDAVPLFSAGDLNEMLNKAGVRIAVFSACNSGRWYFVEPLLKAGLPALIGVQGATTNLAATVFCQKLFSTLAVGLSLDEAVIYARLLLYEESVAQGTESCHWGSFMVYMPTTEAVLFPKPEEQPQVQLQQEQVRRDVSQLQSKQALRKAILKEFDVEELELLCADLEDELKGEGIDVELDLENFEGKGKEKKILDLIECLDRRTCLPRLLKAVGRLRPASSIWQSHDPSGFTV